MEICNNSQHYNSRRKRQKTGEKCLQSAERYNQNLEFCTQPTIFPEYGLNKTILDKQNLHLHY